MSTQQNLRILKNLCPMHRQKLPQRAEFLRQVQGLAFVGAEGVVQGLVGGGGAEVGGEDEAEVFVKRDQAAVEGFVVEDVQAEAVVGVDPVFGVRAPGEDVAGDEQTWDRDSSDAALGRV